MSFQITIIKNDRFYVLLSVHLIFTTQIVDNYLKWTHAPTHNMYHMCIRNLYAVNRSGEQEQFMFDIGNRLK